MLLLASPCGMPRLEAAVVLGRGTRSCCCSCCSLLLLLLLLLLVVIRWWLRGLIREEYLENVVGGMGLVSLFQ